MTESESEQPRLSLERSIQQALKGIDIVETEDRVIFAADVKQIRATPTPKDKVFVNFIAADSPTINVLQILPPTIVEISNLYAESLREIGKNSGGSTSLPVFAGGMAILTCLPVYRVPFKTALQALHRVFYIAKRKGIASVNEEAFAGWQTHCLRNLDKKTSAAMLIVDASAGTSGDRDMLRRFGYECPDESASS